MLGVVLLLLLALFALFYALLGGQLPETSGLRSVLTRYALPALSCAGNFLAAVFLLGPPAGLPWAVLGWFLPSWAAEFRGARRQARYRAVVQDFVTAAAGLYGAGQVTPEVVRAAAEGVPEPFKSEFAEMLKKREREQMHFRFPEEFRRLAARYRLPELAAVAAIIEASETAGGPQAASRGLRRLSEALRLRDRLAAEREKALAEVKVAGYVVLAILLAGLAADATLLRGYFAGAPGKVVAALASAIVVGLIFALHGLLRNRDLEGVV